MKELVLPGRFLENYLFLQQEAPHLDPITPTSPLYHRLLTLSAKYVCFVCFMSGLCVSSLYMFRA